MRGRGSIQESAEVEWRFHPTAPVMTIDTLVRGRVVARTFLPLSMLGQYFGLFLARCAGTRYLSRLV